MILAPCRLETPRTAKQKAHTQKIGREYLLRPHYRIGNVTHVDAPVSWWTNISRDDFHLRAVK